MTPVWVGVKINMPLTSAHIISIKLIIFSLLGIRTLEILLLPGHYMTQSREGSLALDWS